MPLLNMSHVRRLLSPLSATQHFKAFFPRCLPSTILSTHQLEDSWSLGCYSSWYVALSFKFKLMSLHACLCACVHVYVCMYVHTYICVHSHGDTMQQQYSVWYSFILQRAALQIQMPTVATELSCFRRPSVNSLIREYFEQVLQNHKKWTPNTAPCSIVGFVLDRRYK